MSDDSGRVVGKNERVAPFSAVRGRPDGVEVRIEGEWYRLAAISEFDVDTIVASSKQRYGSLWLKRLGEDLPMVFADLGEQLHTPVHAVVRTSNGEERTLRLDCTAANRTAALQYNRAIAGRPVRKDVTAPDIRALTHILEDRFAYWDLARPNLASPVADLVREVLDATRSLELAIAVTLGRLGDGHTRTTRSLLELMVEEAVADGRRPAFLPFGLAWAGGGFVAVQDTPLVSSDTPYVFAIDGRELSEWISAATAIAPKLSPQASRRFLNAVVSSLHWSRRSLGLPHRKLVNVTFGDDRGNTVDLELECAALQPRPHRPERKPRTFDGIGYLPLAQMGADTAESLTTLGEMKHTAALVVDLRGNSGGRRNLVWDLAPHFLEADGDPVVYSVAAKRLFPSDDPAHPDLLADRGLFRLGDRRHGAIHLASVTKFMESFRPEWLPPRSDFSDWRVGVIDPHRVDWHYTKPVAVLTDELCFSACEIFASALRLGPKVTLIGSSTGGGSGRPVGYALPDSGIQFQASSMASFRPNGELYEGKGVAPDVAVERTVEDAAGTSDSVLDRALEYLRSAS